MVNVRRKLVPCLIGEMMALDCQPFTVVEDEENIVTNIVTNKCSRLARESGNAPVFK